VREVFVDTGAWLALADRSERHHAAVREAYADLLAQGAQLVTTDLVLAESHILIRKRLGSAAAMRFLDATGASPRIAIAYATAGLLQDAIARLARYDDEDMSLADAVSFAVMADRAITTALALDRHFRTAGFAMVPSGNAS